MFWQNPKLADNLRQLPIALHGKHKGDFAVSGFFGTQNIFVIGLARREIGLECVKAENHVFGLHRFAIAEMGFRPQAVDDTGIVFRVPNSFRQKAVSAKGFVEAFDEKLFIDTGVDRVAVDGVAVQTVK